MTTKCCSVCMIEELLLTSSRPKRTRIEEVIISQRKGGDLEEDHLPRAVTGHTGNQRLTAYQAAGSKQEEQPLPFLVDSEVLPTLPTDKS